MRAAASGGCGPGLWRSLYLFDPLAPLGDRRQDLLDHGPVGGGLLDLLVGEVVVERSPRRRPGGWSRAAGSCAGRAARRGSSFSRAGIGSMRICPSVSSVFSGSNSPAGGSSRAASISRARAALVHLLDLGERSEVRSRRQQVLAVLGDAPLRVGGDLRVLLQGLEDDRLLDDGVLAQQQDLLEVGRQPPGEARRGAGAARRAGAGSPRAAPGGCSPRRRRRAPPPRPGARGTAGRRRDVDGAQARAAPARRSPRRRRGRDRPGPGSGPREGSAGPARPRAAGAAGCPERICSSSAKDGLSAKSASLFFRLERLDVLRSMVRSCTTSPSFSFSSRG